MDPSLKVSLMNHCVICLRKVGDGEGMDEEEVPFKFEDSPSFLATFNEFWRVLKGNQSKGIRETEGISLTTVMKAKGQGDSAQRSMTYFSEAPTLCHLCGDKVINVDNLMKAVRQQVREAQLVWIKSRSKVINGGRRLKKFEKYLEENGLGRRGIQTTFQFMGISQGQPIQDDKIRQMPVVKLHRVQVPIKQEPVDIGHVDDEVPLQLDPVTGICKQLMDSDDDGHSNSFLDNGDSNWGSEGRDEEDPLLLPEHLDKEEERRKRKAERERQRRAMIRERGPLTDEDVKKREEQKKKHAEWMRARRLAAKMNGAPLSEEDLRKREEHRRINAEKMRERRQAAKNKGGPLSEEEIRKREEHKRKNAERMRARRAAQKLKESEATLTPEQLEAKLAKEKERRKREAERKRARRAALKLEDNLDSMTLEQLEEKMAKEEERRKKDAERRRVYRAAQKLKEKGELPVVETVPMTPDQDDKEQHSDDVDMDIDNDSDWSGGGDDQDDGNYSISEQIGDDDDDDDDYKPEEKEKVKRKRGRPPGKSGPSPGKSCYTPGKRGRPPGKREPLSEEEKRRKRTELSRQWRARQKGKPLTAEQLERREEWRRRKNERQKFERIVKKVSLEMGPLTEEQKREQEIRRLKDIERFRAARAPVGYDKDGNPIYTEKQLERRRRECERLKRRMRLIRDKEKTSELTPEQLEKRAEEKRKAAEKAKFKRIEKQIQGFTPEEIRKHEEYNAKRKEKQRLERERIRAVLGPVPRKTRKTDKRTLAKMALQEPLEILVSLKQPVDQQQEQHEQKYTCFNKKL